MSWRYTCDIKQHFPERAFRDSADFRASRDAVVAELKRAEDYETDELLQEVVYLLATSENVIEFNYYLDDLYDWADARRVWLGI